jgi:Wadjet anti plasmid transformation system JetA-like protein
VEAPLLEAEQLEQFGRVLQEESRKRVNAAGLWRAFAAAFPHRPQGPSERRLLLTALKALETRGLLRLPADHSRRWDRATQPPVPASIDLIREPLPRSSDDWRRFPWHPSLQWVLDMRGLSSEQTRFLERVHRGLVDGDFREPVPLKYRSLQLTGHEKRLADLARGALFGVDRLTLDLLGCLPETCPLAWEAVGDGDSMLIFENAGPFTVACRVLSGVSHSPYGMVAYGAGRSVTGAIGHLPNVKRPIRRVDYVGDLDGAGLDILVTLRERAAALGLPPVYPATNFHVAMLRAAAVFGAGDGWPAEETKRRGRRIDDLVRALDAVVAERVGAIIRRGRRVPEEVLGPGEMQAAMGMPASRVANQAIARPQPGLCVGGLVEDREA